MEVNHILIFSNYLGKEAEELVKSGLKEGSNRIHPGQGTRNRKFYFENFFLELVWVYNESEISSEITAPTGLWKRAAYKTNGYSPIGLCLSHTTDLDDLFYGSLKYTPAFAPEGQSFEIITNDKYPYLPWTCRLPRIKQTYKTEEPTDHAIGIENLTTAKFGIAHPKYQNKLTDFLESGLNIVFESAKQHRLTLEFDHKKSGKSVHFRNIPLTIEY